ncbi:MAG: hypothetical protein MAG451_00115 [Anaerolineales bacterium]|nr:hypothetical protein [Anaerolineales bacterium]
MPDENADAIRELVAEWLDRARPDLILAQMIVSASRMATS